MCADSNVENADEKSGNYIFIRLYFDTQNEGESKRGGGPTADLNRLHSCMYMYHVSHLYFWRRNYVM